MPVPFSESERQTRKKRIDPKLKALGWEVAPFEEGKSIAEHFEFGKLKYAWLKVI